MRVQRHWERYCLYAAFTRLVSMVSLGWLVTIIAVTFDGHLRTMVASLFVAGLHRRLRAMGRIGPRLGVQVKRMHGARGGTGMRDACPYELQSMQTLQATSTHLQL